jgi:hypothetical protein
MPLRRKGRSASSGPPAALSVVGGVVVVYFLDAAKLPFGVSLLAGLVIGGALGLIMRFLFGR